MTLQGHRACSGRHVVSVVIILDDERNTVQWPADRIGRTRCIHSLRLCQRVGIDVDHRVELRPRDVEGIDAGETTSNERSGSDLPRTE